MTRKDSLSEPETMCASAHHIRFLLISSLNVYRVWMWSSGLGTGRKAKRMVLQCINGAGSNPVEGRTKICQL